MMKRCSNPSDLATELLPWGVLVAEAGGRVAVANNACRILLGVGDASWEGVEVECDGCSVRLTDLLREHASGSTARRRVELEVPGHGWLGATLTRVDGGGGSPVVHVVFERRAVQDWRSAGRSDPLAAFAHELRNALTPLREGLSLVWEGAGGDLTEGQERMLDGVRGDAERIARLADEMLSTSRVRCGQARVAARQVDVARLARDVVRSFQPSARREAVDLATGDVAAAARCYADPDLLTQALANLVGNALKFTPAGGTVRVGVALSAGDRGEGVVEIAVRDTGPGLPPQELERLSRARGAGAGRAPAHERAGLGLGLPIVREIMEQHGGCLGVTSEQGAGSCFRLVVPSDFRSGERWLLAQIGDRMELAAAVGATLSLVELRLQAEGAWRELWASLRGMVQLPLIEQCLEECLRPSDAVVMGEGYASLVLHDVDGESARRVAERTAASLARLFAKLPEPFPGHAIAFGVGCYPADGATAAQVLAAARCRCWQAGRDGSTQPDPGGSAGTEGHTHGVCVGPPSGSTALG